MPPPKNTLECSVLADPGRRGRRMFIERGSNTEVKKIMENQLLDKVCGHGTWGPT